MCAKNMQQQVSWKTNLVAAFLYSCDKIFIHYFYDVENLEYIIIKTQTIS